MAQRTQHPQIGAMKGRRDIDIRIIQKHYTPLWAQLVEAKHGLQDIPLAGAQIVYSDVPAVYLNDYGPGTWAAIDLWRSFR